MLRPAVHCAILIVDVERFADPARTNAHQLAVRDAMYQALRQSFSSGRISWADCVTEDRGDGVLVLIPPVVPKSWLVTRLPAYLAEALVRHNAARPEQERIRLRMALHAGEVHQDPHGFAGVSINRAFRLIEAPASRAALRDSSGVVALIVSDWFYDEVVRHYPAAGPSYFRQVHVVMKETEMTAWVRVLESGEAPARRDAGRAAPASAALSHLTRVGHSLPPSPPGVRYSLPPDVTAFTGRHEELDRITASVTEGAGAGGMVAIHAIDGMPGVGKTTLAVHIAHLLRHRFPDRQLFINLHGHTPGQDPLTPEAALAGLLTAIGVDVRNLPGDLQGRTSLWRDRMAGQRAVLVLDNAARSDQVAPLLPGDEGCLVLVTSRRYLGDLPGTAVPVLLQVLSSEEAREMFVRLVPRASGPDPAVAELVRLAGFLPLAISLLARVFARHPSWTLTDLAAETRASMLTLAAEKDSVAAAFEVSCRHLDPDHRKFFQYLGLHPGTTIDGYAAAALAGTGLREAARYLDVLHGEGLLTEAGYHRYNMHDLIRRYVRDRAAADPVLDRQQALDRLLDYYQHTAALAEARLAHRTRTSPAPALLAPPAGLPALAGADQALAWVRAERLNLLACLDHVTHTGQHARVVALTAAMAALLRQDGPWADALARHATAVEAARHIGDRLGQASALLNLGIVRWLTADYPGAAGALAEALGISRDLGDRLGQASALLDMGAVRWLTGDYPGAAEALAQALGIFRDLSDRRGEADALNRLGVVRWLTGEYQDAAEAQQEALDIFRAFGDRRGEADALNRLGGVRRLIGDYPAAADVQQEALGIYRNIGDRGGEVETLNELGMLYRVRGDLGRAGVHHRQALDLAREIASPWDEAQALAGLGRCALAASRATDAIAGLGQAREIFERIGAAEAAAVAAELDGLSGPGPTA